MNWNNLEIPNNPYFMDDNVVIYCADCREILPLLPDKSMDLILTDPPYGIDLDLAWLEAINNKRLPSKSIDKIIGDDGNFDSSFLFQYSRWIVFGFPYIFNSQATGWLVWDKQPGLNTDRTITTPVEMALTNIWQGFRLVRCMWAGYMRDNGEYRYKHPTQKPTKVIDYCITMNEQYVKLQGMAKYLRQQFDIAGVKNIEVTKLFPSKTGGLTGCVSNWLLGFNIPTCEEYQKIKTYLGDRCFLCEYNDLPKYAIADGLILDPFLGSGTTAYCAKKLGRKCIGIEIEEKYCEIAAKRCSQSAMRLE